MLQELRYGVAVCAAYSYGGRGHRHHPVVGVCRPVRTVVLYIIVSYIVLCHSTDIYRVQES
jgi:hypothetical protein